MCPLAKDMNDEDSSGIQLHCPCTKSPRMWWGLWPIHANPVMLGGLFPNGKYDGRWLLMLKCVASVPPPSGPNTGTNPEAGGY